MLIDVPEIYTNQNEKLEEARQLRVLWAVRGDLWIELTEDNLRYVRSAISHSEPAVRKVSKRALKLSPNKRHRKRGRKPGAHAVGNQADPASSAEEQNEETG